MPTHCPLDIERLSTEQLRALNYAVMGHMFASQNEIGRLADEQVYRSDVAQRLDAVGIQSNEETPIELTHKTFAKTLALDLVPLPVQQFRAVRENLQNTPHIAPFSQFRAKVLDRKRH